MEVKGSHLFRNQIFPQFANIFNETFGVKRVGGVIHFSDKQQHKE